MGNESGPTEPTRQRARGAVLLPGKTGGSDRGPHSDIFIIIPNRNKLYFPVYFHFKENVAKVKGLQH